MKLKSVTLYAMYPDGLVLLKGYEFEFMGRKMVVHKARSSNDWDKYWKVSEATTGMSLPIEKTNLRVAAVAFGMAAMGSITDERWAQMMDEAARQRKELKIKQ